MSEWEKLLSKKRFKKTMAMEESGRSHFHKDYDRVIFSHAFRRLAKKTQVHPLVANDHIHTRLTHSLEVASLGRSLGIGVGDFLEEKGQLPLGIRPDDLGVIVQAACLAHDIGNPPFGHTGEDGIRDWFCQPKNEYLLAEIPDEAQQNDFLFYEGNAQGFRIVTKLEKHLFQGGLRLTYPTLGTLLKYPWLSSECPRRKKFSCFESEKNYLNKIGEELGMESQGENCWSRHPLSYLVEAADDICYRILDLEDAVELNIISWPDFLSIFEPLVNTSKLLGGDVAEYPVKSKMALVRGKAMEILAERMVDTFEGYSEKILAGHLTSDLISVVDTPSITQFMSQAALVAEEKIFRNQAKTEIEVGAYSTLEVLLNAFISAVFQMNQQDYASVSKRNRSLLDLMGVHRPSPKDSLYQSYLRVLDFISGMTDTYAMQLANRIGGIVI